MVRQPCSARAHLGHGRLASARLCGRVPDTPDPAAADLAFLLVDWALDRQLEQSGAFLTDLDLAGPSFHTAYVAESVAACGSLAAEIGDVARAARYARSCEQALAFMSTLVIQADDLFCMRDPDALGGVRLDTASSEVRIDYVSHTLLAHVRAAEAARAAP